jgi:pimeloyl-ACP methyl ester carboxylesterase
VIAQQTVPRFEKTADCPFTPGDWSKTVRLECGSLIVYRVRERPADGTLKLAVAIVHPLEGSTGIPLVLPHGGPSGPGGLHGGEMGSAAGLAPALKRDVIVYDERGAGASEPALCPTTREETPVAQNLPLEERQKIWNQGARMCATEIRGRGFDTAMFSTTTNADDLIDLRKARRYPSWDVYGVSYGSRIAQEVMRRDSQGIRSAILAAPVMPGPSQELEGPVAFQRFMDHVFGACASQPSCAAAFPTVAKDLETLYAQLNKQPLDVVFETAAGKSTARLDGDRLLRALQTPRRVDRVPLFIHELLRGDRERAARALLGFASVAPGNNTLTDLVGCFESGGPGAVKEILTAVRAETRPQYQSLINTQEECPFWQQRFAAPADRSFVKSAIPTLILTAEFDDRTPTDYGRRIAAHLEHAQVVELPGLAHGQPHPCQNAIVRSFLEDPTRPPDTSCVAAMPPLVFETKNLEPVSLIMNITTDDSPPSPFAGRWEGAFPNAPVVYRFDLTIAGGTVRGVINAGVQAFTVFDARVEGQTLIFKTKTAGDERTITFTGKLDGDRIAFTRDVAVRPGGNPGGAALWGAAGAPTFTMVRQR